MSHRINVIIEDQVWKELQQIPKGERSQAVNASLMEWLLRQKRQRLLKDMQATAETTEARGEDSVTLLRRQRYRLQADDIES